MKPLKAFSTVFTLIALAGLSPLAQAVTADLHVKLRRVVEKIDLVTDINVVDNSLFICTQQGLLLRKNLNSLSTTDASVFLDLRSRVGMLGARPNCTRWCSGSVTAAASTTRTTSRRTTGSCRESC